MRLRTLSLLLLASACGELGPRTAPPLGPLETMVGGGGGGEESQAVGAVDDAEERKKAEARLQEKRTALETGLPDELDRQAAAAIEKQNWKDAKTLYQRLVVHHPQDSKAPKAAQEAAGAIFRLGEYQEAFDWLLECIVLFDGTVAEARLLRVVGNLYFAVPHYGTERGGEFHRARYDQGIYKNTYRGDRARGIHYLELARERFAELAKPELESERIDTQFDLISAVARFTPFDPTWGYWYYPWGETSDDELVDEEGADERAGRWHGGGDILHRAQPRGLPVDTSGNVIFVSRPTAYAKNLDDTAKLKFLLHETLSLDRSQTKERAAEALLRQALLFRVRDGSERLQRLANYWWAGERPYQATIEAAELHQLEDDETLGLVATHVGVYRVPEDESPLRIFREIIQRYPDTKSADTAAFYIGTFYQSRQQYPKAIEAFDAYLTQRPSGAHAGEASQAIREMRRGEVRIDASHAQPAGRPATLALDHRNLDRVYVEVTRLNLEKFLADVFANADRQEHYQTLQGIDNPVYFFLNSNRDTNFERYKTKDSRQFELDVERDPTHRYRRSDHQIPVQEAGLYVVSVYLDQARKERASRGLLMMETTAIVEKSSDQGPMIWVVDAMSGKPLANAPVEILEIWSEWKQDKHHYYSNVIKRKTDERGISTVPSQEYRRRIVIVRRGKDISFGSSYFSWRYYPSTINRFADRTLVFTDRPVYRPEQTVKLKVFGRRTEGQGYASGADVKNVLIQINDPAGARVFERSVKASDHGTGEFEFVLKKNAPLGLYNVNATVDGRWTHVGGGQFRVEEYKVPEFEVTVSVGDGPAKLGAKIPVKVRGSYYFGGGVENGRARYKVFRTDHEQTYVSPGPWDWLYGPGYGLCHYSYPWFGWWRDWGWHSPVWYPWWGPAPAAVKELVLEGEGRLDAKGELVFELDTADAKAKFGDSDQKFIVEAEVTDASRRTIEGKGEVLATRHQFFVHAEADRGYYQTGNTISFRARAMRPDQSPQATRGELRVARVKFKGDTGHTIEETPVLSRPAETGAESGEVELRFDAKQAGQYRLSYVTKDAWGNEVVGTTLVWVHGPGFDGRRFRFNHLEVITDKRTYEVGETARVLISSDIAGASVLFTAFLDQGHLVEPQVLALEGKTRVVSVPISAKHVPNFFIEATLVGDGKVSQEIRELFVPPKEAEIMVSLRPKKKTYKAGEEAEVEVVTTLPDGRPVSAEVAVSIYDRAVTYIQPELTPEVRSFFWGQKRSAQRVSASNLERSYQQWQSLNRPDQNASWKLSSASSAYFQQQLDLQHGSGLGGLRGGDETGREEEKAAGASAPAPAAPVSEPPAKRMQKSELASAEMDDSGGGAKEARQGLNAAPGDSATVQPTVRKSFADTALFETIRTDQAGKGVVKVRFPDNLTTWNIKGIGMTQKTQVGETKLSVITTKNLIVRLETPRFFRERDRIMLTANVMNRLSGAKKVKVELSLDEELLEIEGSRTRTVSIESGKEGSVDFWVKVKSEGQAKVKIAALTDEESDAKELTIPVLVHGFMKTVSAVDSISAGQAGAAESKLEFNVPAERRPALSKLTVRWSPSLAGAMIDALPYLLDYPYGCTEQTMSRFLPAVLTRRSLQQFGGYKLEDLQQVREGLNPQHLKSESPEVRPRREQMYRRFDRNPVFNSELMDDMIAVGLERLGKMQQPDGGWGWWSSDRSSLYTTAYVVWGLWEARNADVKLPSGMIERGQNALRGHIQGELAEIEKNKDYISNEHAFHAFVMSLFGEKNEKLNDRLFERRVKLSAYGKSMLALALHQVGDKDRSKLVLENVLQFVKEDDENQTAWIDTGTDYWWYWWNNDVETNATFLRALSAISPKDPRGPKLVKWLLNHRHNGWYWRSTRDTAITIASFAQYMRASGEDDVDYDLEIVLDGKVRKTVHIDKTNFLSYDGELVLEGSEVEGGDHELLVRRKGKGAVYYNVYLSYFTMAEDEKAAGLEVKVNRSYYKLVREDRTHQVHDQRGQATAMKEAAYRKVPLQTGDQVQSGDLILVELMVESKNDYEFLAFEDPKPAGAEPVALRSGVTFGEAVANLELRDEKVVFFMTRLSRGKLKLDYRLRAQIPGSFHVMPTHGFAMYAPEIQATSDELRLGIEEGPK